MGRTVRGIGPDRPPKLIVTAGDVRGIGPEVVAAALSIPTVRRWGDFIVVGPAEALPGGALDGPLGRLPLDRIPLGRPGDARVPEIAAARWRPGVEADPPGRSVARGGTEPGRVPADTAGRWAGAAIEAAVGMILRGEADALITAPIDKGALAAGGYAWPGHTEFLAHLASRPHVTMLLAGGLLRVALVTRHVAFADVYGRLTVERVEWTVAQTLHGLRGMFGISSPRIAVCGLNPHAGERGLLGPEEADLVAPVVGRYREAGVDVTGPHPADTVFGRAVAGGYDAVVALYHDQALGPFKLHAFGRGVNMTLGLPFVRTSPDHGTALDIAGKGIADPRSMIHAIRAAAEACRRAPAESL